MQKKSKSKLNKSNISHMLKFFGFSKAPIRSIVVVLALGFSLGVAYEEMVGVGIIRLLSSRLIYKLMASC
jgi:hypothetical protein